jgi:uncharacterized protein
MRLGFCCVIALLLLLTERVWAQCASNASSCVGCHEAQGLRPVLQSAQPWHRDHAFGDLCAACHAGDPTAESKQSAHIGLQQPLLAGSSACVGCHATDASARSARYASAFEAGPGAAPPSAKRAASSGKLANGVLSGVALALSVALVFAWRGGGRSTPESGAPPRQSNRSVYFAGALLGVLVAFSEVVYARPLAASGAFDKLSAYLGRWLFPNSQYYGQIMKPGLSWQVWVVCGVLVGSWAASRWSGQARLRWLPDTQWEARFGSSRQLRLLVAFSGAALVQFGAGIAGGCTSGLAISGGAALAPGAFVFMAGMFASGIPTAWLWYRGRRD